jgi:hypothetical protein
MIAAASLAGLASLALAQGVDDLRPTLSEDDPAAPSEELELPKQPQLEVSPLEPPPPRRRPRLAEKDPYAPEGLGSKVLRYFPSLAIDTVYSSNPTRSSSNSRSDVGVRLKPSVSFESDWVRHSWTGQASSTFLVYAEQDERNEVDADVSSRVRLDVRRTTRAEFDARYALNQTGSEDSEVPDTAVGTRNEHSFGGGAALIHDFGPLEGRLKTGLSWQLYEDVDLAGGGTEDNSDRDYLEPSVSVRATYTDPPVFKPFVEVAYAPRFHDRRLDRNGQRRDSHGVTASAGVVLDRGPIWSGEAAVTYSVRDYEDPALATADVLGVAGNVTWRPTEITTVVASASTNLNETSAASTSANRSWTFGANVTQAVRDNVDLKAGAGVTLEDQASGTDVTVDANLEVEWKLNPWLSWTAAYDGVWFQGVSNSGDYREHRITTGVRLQP